MFSTVPNFVVREIPHWPCTLRRADPARDRDAFPLPDPASFLCHADPSSFLPLRDSHRFPLSRISTVEFPPLRRFSFTPSPRPPFPSTPIPKVCKLNGRVMNAFSPPKVISGEKEKWRGRRDGEYPRRVDEKW